MRGGVKRYKLWLCLVLGAFVFAFGCKQTSNNDGQNQDNKIGSNEITITVKGDAGVEVKEPASFKVKKSSFWKDIKEKAREKVTPKENKVIKEWRVKNANGKVLQEGTTFEKDEVVFAVSIDKNNSTPSTEKNYHNNRS